MAFPVITLIDFTNGIFVTSSQPKFGLEYLLIDDKGRYRSHEKEDKSNSVLPGSYKTEGTRKLVCLAPKYQFSSISDISRLPTNADFGFHWCQRQLSQMTILSIYSSALFYGLGKTSPSKENPPFSIILFDPQDWVGTQAPMIR